MFKEEGVVTAMGVLGGVLLAIATPELSRDAKIVCWLAFSAFWIGYGIYKYRQLVRRSRMTIWVAIVVGGIFGMAGGAIAFSVFPPKADAPAESNGKTSAATPPSAGPSALVDRLVDPGPAEHFGGVLKPKVKGEVPPTEVPVQVEIGNNFGVLGQLPTVVLRYQDNDIITIDGDDEGLLISAKFYDEKGDLVGMLDRNEFRVSPPHVFWSKFNPDKPYILSVFNKAGEKVFEVVYENVGLVKFFGDFFTRHGKRIQIKKDGLIIDGRLRFGGNETYGAGEVLFDFSSGLEE